MSIKVLLLIAGVFTAVLLLAYGLGWRNLGNQPPAVPQKLQAQGSERPAPDKNP
jgi:hypothetical protein